LNTRLSNAEPAELLCPHCGQSHQATYTHCPNTGKPLHVGRALIGRTIADRYRIVGLLGEGGMGAVYVADHLRIGRKVAIKRLHPELAADEKAVQRFQREARAAGATGHEHIVEILDLGYTEDGAPYLVMEYLRGLSLAQTLKKDGRLTAQRAARIVGQLLAALAAVHENGIVHRDLKPDNIFLTRQGNDTDWVKVLDFGISKMKHEDDGLDLTRTGVMMGTPYYMSPEQARGTKSIDHRVDIYAAGVILHECLTGAVPYAGDNYHALLQQILKGDPPPPSSKVPGLPRELDDVVVRALAKEPERRFPSAMQMLDALVPFGAPRPSGRRHEAHAPPSAYEPGDPTVSDSGVRADAHVATEPLDIPPPPVLPPRPDSSGIGLSRPAAVASSAARIKLAQPTPGTSPQPKISAEAPPSRPYPLPPPTVSTPNERYFFAASDDFVAERAKSIVTLGRGSVASALAAPERSGPTSAVRDVLSAALDTTPRPAPPIRSRERGDATGPIATHGLGSTGGTEDTSRRALAEANVKGAIVVGALEHVDAAHGPRTGSLVLVRLDPAHRSKLEGVILPMAWLPLSVLEQLVRVTDEVAGRGDGMTVEAIGRACADRELPTTHRMFMQSATPTAAVERVPQLYRSYFSRGDARLLSSGPNAARLGFEGTGLDSPVLTPWTGGFLARLLELSGARDVRVTPGRGEKGDEKGTFAVRWR
jgi:serine/threonine-protein kinase